MKLVIGICVIFLIIKGTTSACNFPAGFQNTWTTSTRGTWVVGPSSISNVSIYTTLAGPKLYTMDCYDEFNGFYVIRSQEKFQPFSSTEFYIYMCLSLTELSTYKYTYAFGTTEVKVVGNIYERLILRPTSVLSVAGADVCNDTSYESSPDRFHVALLSGFETSGKQDCPSIMHGTFSYAGTSCSKTFVDICTDKGQVSMNTTQCSEKTIYSDNGVLDCVYEKTIGSNTFVTVYNEDPSPDGSSYYQFSCLAVSRAGLLLYTSVNPEKCASSQVSTKSPTSGYVTVYTDDANSTCYTSSTTTSSTEDLTWLYVLIAVFGLLLVLGILLIIFCKLKREKTIQDEEVAVESESDTKSEKEDEKSDVEEKEEKSNKDEEVPTTSKKDEGDRTSVDSGVITDKDESRVNCDAVVVALDGGVEKDQTLQDETHQDNKSDVDDVADQNRQSISDEEMETKHQDEGSVDGVHIKPETYQGYDENSESDADPEIKDGEMEDDKSSEGVDTNEEEEEKEKKEDDGDKDEDDGDKYKDDEDEGRKSESRTDRSDSSASFDEGYRDGDVKQTSGQTAIAALSKILITREMEERAREKRSRKKKGVKKLFAARKSKRGKVSFEASEESDDHADLDDMIRHNKTIEVPFMEQYNTKKEIERKLDEEHYWSDDEDKSKFNFQFDEFEEILEKEEGQPKGSYNTQAMEENRLNQKIEDLKDESEDDVDISDELPVGYERNEDGRITRLSDGYVFTDDEFKGYFKPAKLKKIFNAPRLNRNKKGRPTGGLKEDNYGPEEESLPDVKVGQDEVKRSESEEHTSRELQRLSSKSRVVGFDLKEEPDDFSSSMEKDIGSGGGKSAWTDTTAAIRETLSKRLFRKQNKRRKKIQEGDVTFNNGHVVFDDETDNGQPRELNNSIKVYGQHSIVPGVAPKSTLPPIGMQKDSERILMDHKQLQKHDVGLDKNNRALNNFTALPPIGAKRQKVQQLQVKEAFPNVAMETLSDEELEKGESLDIGNEDEFFLVGPSQSENDKLFTRVRGPMYDDGQNQQRQRNVPWSWIKSRHKSNIGGQDVSRSMDDGPHSANVANRKQMDDKRLRELLEELYKDKKYFDHVIDTSDPQSGTVIDTRDLAEHGRDYLLDRAQFWEDRGPVPPRPPPTALGLRISRMQTMHTNGSDSGRFSINSTITPPIIEPPNQIPLRQEQTTLPTIEPTNQIPLRQENTFS